MIDELCLLNISSSYELGLRILLQWTNLFLFIIFIVLKNIRLLLRLDDLFKRGHRPVLLQPSDVEIRIIPSFITKVLLIGIYWNEHGLIIPYFGLRLFLNLLKRGLLQLITLNRLKILFWIVTIAAFMRI